MSIKIEKESKMVEWKNVTEFFSDEQRHYNGKLTKYMMTRLKSVCFLRLMIHLKYISAMINFSGLFMQKKKMFMKSGTR